MKTHCDVLIIGAGIAGLTAARRLVDAGRDVIVVDKGRGVGGRMATRRFSGATFDHGAQFISVRSEEFGSIMEEWLADGVAELWSHGFADGYTGDGSLLTAAADGAARPHMPARDGHPRYRGAPAMTAVAKHLAAGLDIRLGVRTEAVRQLDSGWAVEADAGRSYRSDAVVLTPPVPQTLALLEAGGVRMADRARETLGAIDYDPCIALLALADEPVSLPEPGVLRRPNETIEWIADNRAKGVSELGPAITVHCAPGFSETHYDEADGEVAARIVESLPEALRVPFSATQMKRWRYSRPRRPLDAGAWSEGLPDGLVLAGDAFAGARVEGAVLSGLAAARTITGRDA